MLSLKGFASFFIYYLPIFKKLSLPLRQKLRSIAGCHPPGAWTEGLIILLEVCFKTNPGKPSVGLIRERMMWSCE